MVNGPRDYQVQVSVSIRNYMGGGDLQLQESVIIPDCTFGDMATILGRFHDLATALRQAKGLAASESDENYPRHQS